MKNPRLILAIAFIMLILLPTPVRAASVFDKVGLFFISSPEQKARKILTIAKDEVDKAWTLKFYGKSIDSNSLLHQFDLDIKSAQDAILHIKDDKVKKELLAKIDALLQDKADAKVADARRSAVKIIPRTLPSTTSTFNPKIVPIKPKKSVAKTVKKTTPVRTQEPQNTFTDSSVSDESVNVSSGGGGTTDSTTVQDDSGDSQRVSESTTNTYYNKRQTVTLACPTGKWRINDDGTKAYVQTVSATIQSDSVSSYDSQADADDKAHIAAQDQAQGQLRCAYLNNACSYTPTNKCPSGSTMTNTVPTCTVVADQFSSSNSQQEADDQCAKAVLAQNACSTWAPVCATTAAAPISTPTPTSTPSPTPTATATPTATPTSTPTSFNFGSDLFATIYSIIPSLDIHE